MSETKTLTQAGIDALDRKDFQTYAQDAFGISLDGRKSKEDMVKAFVEAGGEIAEGEDQEPEKPKVKPSAKGPVRGEDMVHESDPRKYPRHDVTIHGQEGEGGGDDVFLSVNGLAFRIQRNQRVSIPWTHLNALRDAVQTVTEQKTIGGEIKTVQRRVQAYNFTDHGPSASE